MIKTSAPKKERPLKQGTLKIQIESDQTESYEMRSIPIDQIDVSMQMIRTSIDPDAVRDLALSILELGLLQPIVVCKRDEGGYWLVAGRHRIEAHKYLKRPDIAARISYGITKEHITEAAFSENTNRVQMTIQEECLTTDMMHNQQGRSVNEIARMMSKSTAWVHRRLAAMTMPKDVLMPLWDGRINIGTAELICQIENDGFRAEIIYATIQGHYTTAQVEAICRFHRDNPQVDGAVEIGLKTAAELKAAGPPTQECGACGRSKRLAYLRPVMVCSDGCSEAMEAREIQEQAASDAQPVQRGERDRGEEPPPGS